jgi:predicted helicase
MHEALKTYITEINKSFATGVAREHAYRPALQNLIETLLPKSYTVVNEPARIDCGAPDFIILKGDTPMAFVEAKDLQDGDLDGRKEHKEQFDRYKNSLDHIIFTDYLDFHLYENGEYVDAVRLADIRGDKIVLLEESENKFLELVNRLANALPQRITSPARLAKVMACKARLLANVIEKALENDTDGTTELTQQMNTFKNLLIHDLNNKTFADIYAQTIAYGLFSARLNDNTPEDFSRMEANSLIPKSNPFLRRIFNDIAGFNVDSRIEWILDDLVEAFRVTDMSKVMRNFGGSSGRTDPMMHFYEDFLSQYDPQTKAQRGVYYTPQPVVDFIVRAVDDILKRDFNLPMGLADNSMIDHEVVNDQYTGKKGDSKTIKKRMHRVQILDPATGTGTFLATAIRQIHANMEGQWGAWNSYVEQHLLPRLNGFELMMASYTIAHLKLGMVLRETGYTQQSDKRLHVYLTNSLEEFSSDTGTLFSHAISAESNEASVIKRDCPMMVMIGNPPYSGESSNKGEWITELMKSYKKEPGGIMALQERNSKWINDDYCKFLRLAQNYIDRNKTGIVAFINNNGFIDNPTFRGMRWSLMKSFDKIYILNLHGNSMKHEVCADGSPDENVFDIMVGTSINICVKTGEKPIDGLSEVYYCDLMGVRQMKYDWLSQHSFKDAGYKKINPSAPHYLFIPQNNDLLDEYNRGFLVSDLMKTNSMGVTTGDDKNLIGYCHNDLVDLGKSECIRDIAYRPFDSRFVYYDIKRLARARWPFMELLTKDNIGLVLIRINSKDDGLCVYVVNRITDKTILSSKDNANVFPLYLYSKDGKNRVPNLDKEIWGKINVAVGEETSPEELFDYIYAVLHSPAYRTKYKEFLKIDFPRIPYPTSAEEYHRLSALGNQLRKIHLMEEVPATKYAQFNTAGSNVVEKPEYKGGSVWINKEQCFEDVPETAWNFYIGGYQPAQKWLKDRKGRELTFDDIAHYRKIITILLETDRLMKEIDGKE